MVAVETQRRADILSAFDIEVASTISGVASGGAFADGRGELIETFDPTTGQVLARVHTPSQVDVGRAVNATEEAFARWRNVPAPRRGEIVRQGGEIVYGGRVLETSELGGFFVEPTIVRSTPTMTICAEEIFAPILHVFEVGSLDEAIELNNNVPHGLAGSLFTRDLSPAQEWLPARGSDCGIANVNVGTSGTEIGGAFGVEKSTGGERQAGSDAWNAFMRRQTCTINYGASLPLAQGVHFDLA